MMTYFQSKYSGMVLNHMKVWEPEQAKKAFYDGLEIWREQDLAGTDWAKYTSALLEKMPADISHDNFVETILVPSLAFAREHCCEGYTLAPYTFDIIKK